MRRFSFLFIVLFLVCGFLFPSSRDPFNVAIGLLRTASDNLSARAVIGFSEKYVRSVEKYSGSGMVFQLSPEVYVEAGANDSFSSITIKARGLFLIFHKKTLGEVSDLPGPAPLVIPDLGKLFHAIPISVGVESDSQLRNIAALLEVGWSPLLYPEQKPFKLGENVKFELLVQTGYKFKVSDVSNGVGGLEDESAESPNKGLARLKASLEIRQNIGSRIGIRGDAVGWYDLVNNEFYHRLDATVRLTMFPGKHFDLKYQNGSGAPNFNKGNQFSANLALEL